MFSINHISLETKRSSYRPEIDGLRALAVIAVIINHFNKDILPSGYLGVDIFFVISGFVITSSLANRSSRDLGDFLLGFYNRRIKRLVPALVLCVAITSLLICFFNPDPGTSLKTGITALFGLSNLYLFKQSTDYFATSTELNVFTHTWSLGVEEQFYFLFPFLVWFTGFSRLTVKGPRNLFLVIGSFSVASLLSFIALYYSNQPAAYFLMPTRFWEMGVGCLLFLSLRKANYFGNTFVPPPLLVLVSIIAVLFIPLRFAVLATITVVFLTAILIVNLRPGTIPYQLFTRKQVIYIGLISYSLYLWHWSVLSLSRWTIGVHWWSVPIQLSLMFFLAMLSYRYVETPLRRTEWSAIRWQSIIYGLLVSSCAALFLFLMGKQLKDYFFIGNLTNFEYPRHLRQTWWRNQNGKYIEQCHVEKEYNPSFLRQCLGKSRPSSNSVFVIGDSHARNYVAAVKELFGASRVYYLTMGHGCAFVPESLMEPRGGNQVNCQDYVNDVKIFLMSSTKNGDVVFVGQSLLGWAGKRQKPIYRDIYRKFLDDLAQELDKNQVPLILLDGTKPPEVNPILCVDVPWRPFGIMSGCRIKEEKVRAAFSDFDTLGKELSHSHRNFFYAPLRVGLCNNGICGQYTKNGVPIWHDTGHITEESSRTLVNLLKKSLLRQKLEEGFPKVKFQTNSNKSD